MYHDDETLFLASRRQVRPRAEPLGDCHGSQFRSLTLAECEKQLLKKKGRLYEAVLLRLAGSVLPRLQEHSGPDGGDIPFPLLGGITVDKIKGLNGI